MKITYKHTQRESHKSASIVIIRIVTHADVSAILIAWREVSLHASIVPLLNTMYFNSMRLAFQMVPQMSGHGILVAIPLFHGSVHRAIQVY